MATKKAKASSAQGNDIYDNLIDESDRAAVLIGVSRIDYDLGEMISRRLLPSPGSVDELFDGDRPLSTFSAKINMAYRLGLITAQFTKTLHLLRKLRNDFAHEPAKISIETGPHHDRVVALVAPYKTEKAFNEFIDNFFKGVPPTTAAFKNLICLVSYYLSRRVQAVQPLDGSKAMNALPPWKRGGLKGTMARERRRHERALAKQQAAE